MSTAAVASAVASSAAESEWCDPTTEVPSATLLELLHRARQTSQAGSDEPASSLVNPTAPTATANDDSQRRLPLPAPPDDDELEDHSSNTLAAVGASAAEEDDDVEIAIVPSYPVYTGRSRAPVRILLGMLVFATLLAAVMFVTDMISSGGDPDSQASRDTPTSAP